RPFSARTLPPMTKSGDKSVEEEVIKTSRELYCKPKAEIEKEINDWSGMSLGDDSGNNSGGNSGSGSFEKFPVICSYCKKETTVPFKPEKGRPVYCKDCIAKIKSGEIKVEKGYQNEVKYDATTFYKPLADLGIEFPSKDTGNREQKPLPPPMSKPKVLAVKPPSTLGGFTAKPNSALKEVLNKIKEPVVPVETPKKVVEPVSLNSLKNKIKDVIPPKDKAASSENMNKLKSIISEKIPPIPTLPPQPIPPASISVPQKPVKEVPEDVLRKVLEE
ncbi:MAG: hypothetical protein Q7K54_03635, partial [Candidatus Parcubacteria bacterium]|nr:hypothetical protein [Candidatus Parcubacteria bacterium]